MRGLYLIVLLLLSTAALAQGADAEASEPAAEQPEPQPQAQPPAEQPDPPESVAPADPLVVRELSVFLLDHFGEQANSEKDYGSSLFNGAYRWRRPGTAGTPMPLGLISFEGPLDTPRRLRLELPQESENARFLGHWPKTQAQARSVEWHDLRPATDAQRAMPIDARHWLAPLRQDTGRTRFTTRGNTDRFLLYDVSFPMNPPVLVTPGNSSKLTLRANAQFDGYRGGEVLILDKDGLGIAWAWAKLNASDSTIAQLGQTKSNGKPLESLQERLQTRGYNDAEIHVALEVIGQLTLENWGMSAVCLLDKSAMDALLPLTVEPAADRIERIGLVVLTNIDPDINATLDQYIAQLGSEQWAVRDAAQRALIDMGHAAIERVQSARNHTDPEVAFRVQQIIDAYELKYSDAGEPDR